MFWVLGIACQHDVVSTTDTQTGIGDVVEEACVNTFSPAPKPNLRITDYSQTLPTREDSLPQYLSESVLYSDIRSKEIHPAVYYYEPRYSLWS